MAFITTLKWIFDICLEIIFVYISKTKNYFVRDTVQNFFVTLFVQITDIIFDRISIRLRRTFVSLSMLISLLDAIQKGKQ